MPVIEEWDTPNNKAAMPGGSQDDKKPKRKEIASKKDVDETHIMAVIKSAYKQGLTYQTTNLQPRWIAANAAFNNQHQSESKYLSARWRGRSRLFRPKTRATVRRKSAEAAAALHSTTSAVVVEAQNEADAMQAASAKLIHELVNYRLDRSTGQAGIPWFAISMGAHMSAQLNGVCISKQYWEYEEKIIGEEEAEILDEETGEPVLDVMGQPMLEMKPIVRKVKDRPRVILYPPEDCIRDPSASWENQAQESSYLILLTPIPLSEVRNFLAANNTEGNRRWRDVSDDTLKAQAGRKRDGSMTAESVRRSRENNGQDRYSDNNVEAELKPVWLHENFLRLNGTDWNFWTLGTDVLLCDPIPVEDAYPHNQGQRPVSIGVGSIEPFKTDPMSPVTAWQPLQQEINDLANLRLDVMKQTVSPLTKVKRGKSIDIKALQNRSPDTVLFVQDQEDVEFDRPGEANQSSYLEMEKLNADFDDQAGAFSIGSVQTNRMLGDTVGGMNLVAGSANAMGEFDLRAWVETWAEDVIRQIVRLEQYYEDDETALAVAGQRAKLAAKFGFDEITDEMLSKDVFVYVNLGLGASDPMQALQKMGQAAQIVGMITGPGIVERVNQDNVIEEVFGKAGYKNAAERFFLPKEEVPSPEMQQAQEQMQQMGAMIQQLQQELADKAKAAELQMKDKEEERKFKGQEGDKERATRVHIAKISTLGRLAGQEQQHEHQKEAQDAQFGHEVAQADADMAHAGEMHAMKAESDMARDEKSYAMDPATMRQGDTDLHQMLGLPQQKETVNTAKDTAALTQQTAQVVAQTAELAQQSAETIAQTGAQIAEANRQTAAAIGSGLEKVAQSLQQGLQQGLQSMGGSLAGAISESTETQYRASEMMAKKLSAPKTVTAPDGRTYTSRSADE